VATTRKILGFLEPRPRPHPFCHLFATTPTPFCFYTPSLSIITLSFLVRLSSSLRTHHLPSDAPLPMLRSTMTNNLLTLFCLVEGESSPFSVDFEPSKTVDLLKVAIKTALSPQFDAVTAKDITLWHVAIPLAPLQDRKPIVSKEGDSATKLDPTEDVSDTFKEQPPKKTINIIVQRPGMQPLSFSYATHFYFTALIHLHAPYRFYVKS